ncbi:DMT family transporter [Butyrivibrio sp. TB]|uniref:DMT family transporter n=1 Tax=Butyrivibrio sp. TB TaxID=1520809 RepID=UPI0008B2456E|nr:DMT family transporter [Butyrivibrio sp. TB]SEP88353.1 Permease of the drug/metabolite transporter (DMT) superfamily [Butyrivibrio sp. TB]
MEGFKTGYITASPASALLKRMLELELIYPMKGKGQEKYLFKMDHRMKQNDRIYTFTHTLMLLVASFFWGTTFVAQSLGAEYVGAGTYLAFRTYIGIAFLLPFVIYRDREEYKVYKSGSLGRNKSIKPADGDLKTSSILKDKRKKEIEAFIKGGLLAGLFIFLASFAQQYGIAYTSVAKAGFLTALYVVFVPIISVFFGRKLNNNLWICIALSVVGLYLLCMKGSFYLEMGDALMVVSALGFSVQILAVSRYSKRIDPVKLTLSQFIVEAVLATIVMLVLERPDMASIYNALPAILYAGIFSSGIAYTLQALGQKNLNPAIASIAMCLESVFGTLSGWIVLGQSLSFREAAGCVLMFGAIVLSQFLGSSDSKERSKKSVISD